MLLQGKQAIITGARRGIGRATAKLFAEHGANLWVCYRTQDLEFEGWLQKLSEQNGIWIRPLCFDLTDSAAMKLAIKQISAQKVAVDILVNNAGMMGKNTSALMTSSQKIKDTFDVNFFAQMSFTQHIARMMMRKRFGSIINLVSIAGLDGNPGQLDYVASKAAVIGATRTFARELATYGIRVNAIAPGMIDTEMLKHVEDEFMQETIEQIIMKRLGTPEEIAGAILFLASNLSSYMTGQVIRVDGGMV